MTDLLDSILADCAAGIAIDCARARRLADAYIERDTPVLAERDHLRQERDALMPLVRACVKVADAINRGYEATIREYNDVSRAKESYEAAKAAIAADGPVEAEVTRLRAALEEVRSHALDGMRDASVMTRANLAALAEQALAAALASEPTDGKGGKR